jgi:glutaminyl-peptide cyclotransferase
LEPAYLTADLHRLHQAFVLLTLVTLLTAPVLPVEGASFSGHAAFTQVEAQMKLGPRPTGSEAWRATGEYIVDQLKRTGWLVEEQRFAYQGTRIRNIIGRKGRGPVVILGAHYDTRLRADQDKKNPAMPVPGANDGASGVAVLLDLARSLESSHLAREVWLVFFDAEDNGGLGGWEWAAGAKLMAENLTVKPEVVIVVDMVGDADQQIYYDKNSDPGWSRRIWSVAHRLGYGNYFLPLPKYGVVDDHTPFAQNGIPAVDIIDFDYPYWHTTEDTIDKVSPASLERVGRTLEVFLGELK